MTPKNASSRSTPKKAPAPRGRSAQAGAPGASPSTEAVPGSKIAKAGLSLRIAEETGLSRKQAGEVVGSVIDLVVEALQQGRTVGLLGLGTLSITHTAQRQGVRPGTTERITIPAGKKIRFKVSTGLRDELDATR